jgi:hypothetical protein
LTRMLSDTPTSRVEVTMRDGDFVCAFY